MPRAASRHAHRGRTRRAGSPPSPCSRRWRSQRTRGGPARSLALADLDVKSMVPQLQGLDRDRTAVRLQLGPGPLHRVGIAETPAPSLYARVVQQYHVDHLALHLAAHHVLVPVPQHLRVRKAVLEGKVEVLAPLGKLV